MLYELSAVPKDIVVFRPPTNISPRSLNYNFFFVNSICTKCDCIIVQLKKKKVKINVCVF